MRAFRRFVFRASFLRANRAEDELAKEITSNTVGLFAAAGRARRGLRGPPMQALREE